MAQAEWNYTSGDEYTLEFLGYRLAFGARDFEERVGAAAVRLGLVASNDLDGEEVADLVELAADGRIAEARSSLGAYLDHRVKEGLLEITWDEESGEYAYAEPNGGRALLELAPTPSWHALQFRGD